MSVRGRKPIGTIAYMGGVMALPEEFTWAWGQMIAYNSEYLVEEGQSVHYDRAKFSYHSAARNHLARQFLGDWLLMMDTDHYFEPDIAARMLHQMKCDNLDVLTALYHHKDPPHIPVIYTKHSDSELFSPMGDWDKPAERFLIPVASAGAGCLLIKREVFTRIREELKEEPFDITHPFGEDHSFFKRLAKVGGQAWCNPAIESHHLRVQPIHLSDYQPEELTLQRV